MLFVGGGGSDNGAEVVGYLLLCCGNGISRLASIGVILVDSSATLSKSASCFKRLPDVGISGGLERYGEMSAVLAVRLEDEPQVLEEASDNPAGLDVEDDAVNDRAWDPGPPSIPFGWA